jgi:hypothetical protein
VEKPAYGAPSLFREQNRSKFAPGTPSGIFKRARIGRRAKRSCAIAPAPARTRLKAFSLRTGSRHPLHAFAAPFSSREPESGSRDML